MVVKVWDSRGVGKVEEDAMLGGWTGLFVLFWVGLGWSLLPCRQRGFVSSLPWEGKVIVWIIVSRSYQNAKKSV